MPEIALYRKYRPTKFSEVIGQDHIVEVLKGALKSGRPAHAYLFSGSRGTGKTSVARILTQELGTTEKDLYEIDGASNRGIDEIRELREGVRTLPFDSKNKVYIIDEVHMLTKEAFNALLKTLEEPPAHVVFILATTELHKVPETIISRCETHVFKRPTEKALEEVVKRVSKTEGFKIETDAISLIAFLGDGSFRDTLGILQKIMSFAQDGAITAANAEIVTGAPRLWVIFNFILSIMNNDLGGGLAIVRQAAEENRDFKIFTKLAMRELRLAMLLLFSPAMEKELMVGLGETEVSFLRDLKARPNAKILPAILKELLVAYEDINYAYLPQLPLELALIKIIKKKEGESE